MFKFNQTKFNIEYVQQTYPVIYYPTARLQATAELNVKTFAIFKVKVNIAVSAEMVAKPLHKMFKAPEEIEAKADVRSTLVIRHFGSSQIIASANMQGDTLQKKYLDTLIDAKAETESNDLLKSYVSTVTDGEAIVEISELLYSYAYADIKTELKFTANGIKLKPIMLGISSTKGTFFVFNDILYYLNGNEYLKYDGESASEVTGYIPTLTVSRPPAGGGTKLEDFNLLSSGFKDSFSGNGTSTVYHLSLGGLDATPVTAMVNGALIAEGAGLTVDRALGRVTFATAPSGIAPNNVIITAYKTVAGFKDKVKNCKYAHVYGGANDTRVFISGNPNYKNQYWYSGVFDPTYWPENGFNRLGSNAEAITGFVVQYDTLIAFKERSIWSVTFDINGISFPTRPVNSNIGCDMPYSIQLIDNNPVFFNTYSGGYILLSSAIRDERNVKPISGNINGALYRPGILDEQKTDLINATSLDFGSKYYICVGSKAWVWDYELTPYQGNEEALAWFPYTNINANCWLIVDRQFYYGNKKSQIITTQDKQNDFGKPILGVWRSKLFAFSGETEYIDFIKTITEIWFNTRSTFGSEIKITYYNDNGQVIGNSVVPAKNTASFMWDNFRWDQFTWASTRFFPTIRQKPKIKKVVYFQIEFSNDNINENLSILNLVIRYIINRKVK